MGRARYGHEATILTHYGSPAAVVISFEEYQRLKHAAADAEHARGVETEELRVAGEEPEYQLPPEIESAVEEGRRHPERRTSYRRRTRRDGA